MNKKFKITAAVLIALGLLIAAILYLRTTNIAVLNPAGPIAAKERNLLYFGLGLSLVVVIPVFTMAFTFAWRYREGNHKAKYSPNLDRNRLAEITWWGIPTIIIGILSVVAWNGSHTLDPYRPIASVNKTIRIQVVALDWKWLFIYPEQGIATVNYAEIPTNTPINFEITSDAPMNSFWVPQLGGQIYAMPGMSTQLNLLADRDGDYRGSSANISGVGFAGMDFTVHATSAASFDQWATQIHQIPTQLDQTNYDSLALPSQNNPKAYYSNPSDYLYNSIVAKYLGPSGSMDGMQVTTGAGM